MRITQEYAYEFISGLKERLSPQEFMLTGQEFIEILIRDDLSVRLRWTSHPESPLYIPQIRRYLFYSPNYVRKPKQASSLMLWQNINGWLEHYVNTSAKQTLDTVRDFVVLVHSLSPDFEGVETNETIYERNNYLAYNKRGDELIIIDEGDSYQPVNRYVLLNKKPVELTASLNYEITSLVCRIGGQESLLSKLMRDDSNYYEVVEDDGSSD